MAVSQGRNWRGWYAIAACLIGMLALWGCGSDSYTDPDAEYYKNEASTSALIEPETLMSWIDAGYRTESGKRVVILDCVPNPAGVFPYSDVEAWFAGDADKIKANMAAQYGVNEPQYLMINNLDAAGVLGHIPGALPSVSHEGYEVTARNDGPILADHQVGTGSLIDQMIQRFGIQKDDVVVLTTSRYDYPGFCSSRLWWTLRYWGFSKNNLKVLNGGNKAFKMAGGTLEKGVVTLANVTPSTFSVTDLSRRFTDTRTSIGELIDMVDSGQTTSGEVIVLDTRQPPTPFYLTDADANGVPDIFEVPGYTYSDATKLFDSPNGAQLTLSHMLFNDPNLTTQRIPDFNMANPLPFDPAVAAPWIRLEWKNAADPSQGMVVLPLAAKPAGFDGIVHGAKLVKNGSPQWNITVPAVTNATTNMKYKTKEELLPLLAAAGIDGTKPIVTYCNSGALASIYYFILKEVCGFPDVTMYDGSWQEWGTMTAYEPTDFTFVRNNPYTVFPSYPSGIPAAALFADKNDYLEWNATDGFHAAIDTTLVADDHIKAGGALSGNPAWDTVHRSDHVIFRASASLNDNSLNTAASDSDSFLSHHSYTQGVDWPGVTTYPDYVGSGDEIQPEDDSYSGSTTTSGGSDAPSPFVPSGGGC